jgi:hypothetical protein
MSKNVKSILTTAMLNAEGAPETDAETTEETTNAGFAADRKQFIKRAVIAILATAAVTALAIRVFGTSEDEETETTED